MPAGWRARRARPAFLYRAASSEQPPHGRRAYAVRQLCPLTGRIDTIGEVCSIATRAEADRRARRLALTQGGAQEADLRAKALA